jgi:hypothetical protein
LAENLIGQQTAINWIAICQGITWAIGQFTYFFVLRRHKPARQPASSFGHGWQPQHKLCAAIGVVADAECAAVALHRHIHADGLGFGWLKHYKKESGLRTFYLG